MSSFHLFNRAAVIPPASTGNSEHDLTALRDYCKQLGQELRAIHNNILSFSVAVAGAAASKAVVLPVPMQDALYRMSVVSTWGTTHAISAVATTGFTDTFGTNAPGGGGTLYVLVIG